MNYFKGRDASFLCKGTQDDVLFLEYLGNEMLTKTDAWSSLISPGKKGWHILEPKILTDQRMDRVIEEADALLAYLGKHFIGRILLVGAFPRFVQACCGLQGHSLLDENNQMISMVGYTNLFNEYIKSKISLPEKAEFVEYQDIFGKSFDCDSLVDGIHMTVPALKVCANFFTGALKSKQRSKGKCGMYVGGFNEFLREKGLLTAKVTHAETKQREPMDGAIDYLENNILMSESDHI